MSHDLKNGYTFIVYVIYNLYQQIHVICLVNVCLVVFKNNCFVHSNYKYKETTPTVLILKT